MTIEIEIDEDIAEKIKGYKIVRIGKPMLPGEFVFLMRHNNGSIVIVDDLRNFDGIFVILEKIKPKRRVFELVRENSRAEIGELYYVPEECSMNSATYRTMCIYDIYKEIKENE